MVTQRVAAALARLNDAKPRIVLTRTHAPSKSHHTTEVCG
jgi:hypothetical protein